MSSTDAVAKAEVVRTDDLDSLCLIDH